MTDTTGTARASPAPLSHCWCGNAQLLSYSADYRLCAHCKTLVSSRAFAPDLVEVNDEGQDLYGLNYFYEHAKELSQPDLGARAHLDLAERCVHWLKALLEFRPPPARTLELGCASGAFVGALTSAGYQATGQDLSPAVTARAAETFGVPVLSGPLETQDLPDASLDVLILMDVVEHLIDPLATLGTGARILRDDGLLMIQMPNFNPALSHEDLLQTEGPFLVQMKADEHIFLYSRESATALLSRLGFEHVVFLPAIFSMYDMYFVASRTPISRVDEAVWRNALRRSREGRMMEALIDNFTGNQAGILLKHRLDQVEVDRARRLEVILEQQQQLAQQQERGRQQDLELDHLRKAKLERVVAAIESRLKPGTR